MREGSYILALGGQGPLVTEALTAFADSDQMKDKQETPIRKATVVCMLFEQDCQMTPKQALNYSRQTCLLRCAVEPEIKEKEAHK
jgi:hypothetical protein